MSVENEELQAVYFGTMEKLCSHFVSTYTRILIILPGVYCAGIYA
jgi:hypothetical protein